MRKFLASLDIGSSLIKLVVGEVVKNKINILACVETPARGIKKGYVINGESAIEAFKEVFETNNILNSYFNLNSSEKVVYPGPINNFNLIKYKDCWEDPNDEDENFN